MAVNARGKVGKARAVASITLDAESRQRLTEIVSILNKHQLLRRPSPESAKAVLEDLGPTFIKLGQMVSSHSDVFPAEYCETFASLRNETNPLPFEEIEAILRASFGDGYDEIFESVDPVALGSASIAQVHHAVLVSGEEVAVKVQRPGIKPKLREDIKLLRRASEILEVSDQIGIDFDVSQFIDELDRTVNEEIDFRIEAQNLSDFYENNEGRKGISSPHVYEEYSNETVLVMEYIDGLSFEHLDELRKQHGERQMRDFGKRIVQNYLDQMLEDGLFHDDPHPANMMIRGDEVVWIDLGMMGRLTRGERELMRQLFTAVAFGDAAEVKRTLLIWGHASGQIDHPRLLRDIDSMLARYAGRDIANLDLTNGINDLLNILRGQKIDMPGSFLSLARGLMTLQGTVQHVNPEISVTVTLERYLKRTMVDNIDPLTRAENFAADSYRAAEHAMQIPQATYDVLNEMKKGELQINMQLKNIEDPVNALRRSVERLEMGIITAGLFIGSSLLCLTNMEPRVLGIPIIGFIGFGCALVMAIYLVWKLFYAERAKRKYRRNK
ncbi:MAG: AarF/UbiB family protein [Coriobacteriia bacterium]|nr:AarF/UbiB family protein [Coriobacteriia bacterium]